MKINKMVQMPVDAKVLKLHLKVSDCFYATLVDDKGEVLKDHDGYVPDFMPGEHYGDYVYLDIDVDTGQILNWKVPTVKQIEAFIGDGEEDED